MEPSVNSFAVYQEILFTSFDKIQKSLPRKYKQIKELITKSKGLVSFTLTNS